MSPGYQYRINIDNIIEWLPACFSLLIIFLVRIVYLRQAQKSLQKCSGHIIQDIPVKNYIIIGFKEKSKPAIVKVFVFTALHNTHN